MSSTFSATIMKVGYEIAVQEFDDPYISIAEVALHGIAEAGFQVQFFEKKKKARLHV